MVFIKSEHVKIYASTSSFIKSSVIYLYVSSSCIENLIPIFLLANK